MTDYGSGTLGAKLTRSTSANWTAPRVGFLGDSTGNRGKVKLAAMLQAEFATDLAYDCWSGCDIAPLVDDLLERNVWPDLLLVGLGTNNIFDPPSVAAQIQRVLDAAPATTTVVWINTYTARAAQTATVQLHDLRNSSWVNSQIHAALPKNQVVDWNAALGYAVGRGRQISYYLEDGIHQWQAAGTTPYTHGNGVDFWAETVMQVLRPLLQ